MGNKSKYVPHLQKYFPAQYDTYIEPFLGSGAVLLHLQPSKWIVNDINKDLINCWRSLKDSFDDIISSFKLFASIFMPLQTNKKVALCKEITLNLPEMSHDVHRAVLYLLMRFCAYMGVIIAKNKFMFSSLDFKVYKKQNLPYFLNQHFYDKLVIISNYLNNTKGKIYNRDYKYILAKAKREHFVFLDPPYIEDHDYQHNYNIGEVIDELFFVNLKKELDKLDKKGVKWLMTQADHPLIKKLFHEYSIFSFPVFRTMSKTHKNELIIKNY